MFVRPSDLSGLSATSGGMLQRDQQQTAWERGGSVKQSFTEVLPGNYDAYGASVAQKKAFERAARETDPFKRARALEEAAAYGEEAARLKKPGAQRRPGVPVKRAVHLEQITTAEQAELQRREMQRRGVAIAQPKAVQLVAQVRQAVARILPAPVPKPTIQVQQYRMPTAARGGAVYGGGGATGSGYAIQMGELPTSTMDAVIAAIAKAGGTPASPDISADVRKYDLKRSAAPVPPALLFSASTLSLPDDKKEVQAKAWEAEAMRLDALPPAQACSELPSIVGGGMACGSAIVARMENDKRRSDTLALRAMAAQLRSFIGQPMAPSPVPQGPSNPSDPANVSPQPDSKAANPWIAPALILGGSVVGAWLIATSD